MLPLALLSSFSNPLSLLFPLLLIFPSLKVTFSEEDLPKGSGEYMLGYYSHNLNSIVGLTQPFQVLLPPTNRRTRPSP